MKNCKKYLLDLAMVAFFAIVSVAYFAKPVMDGKVLSGHDHTGGVGAGAEMNEYREKHDGERTRWTNTLFSGMPTYQLAPAYGSTDSLEGIKQLYSLCLPAVASYVFIMLLGFYIMLRCFDFKVWMSALGAVLWAFSSYYFIIIAAGHIWKLYTLAFIPPTIGGMALCYRGKWGWGIIVSALFMALQIVSNHVQMTYYFLFPIAALALGWLFSDLSRDGLARWFKGSLAFACGCLLGVAVNISNLYHTWEYSKESMRGKSELTHKTKDPADQTSGGLERSYITAWSYGIGETWTLLVPNAKGGASQPLTRNATAMKRADSQYMPIYQQLGQYWGEQPGTSGPVYVGAFVCMLFVLCLLIVRGPMCWALLLATMLSVALSWGKNFMGLTDFFLDYVPMYDKFRTVASILVIAEFTIPLMAVMALRRFVEEPSCVRVRVPVINKEVNAIWLSFVITGGICFLFWLMPDVFFGNYISTSEANGLQSLAAGGYVDQAFVNGLMENLGDMRRAMFKADALRSFLYIAVGTMLLALRYKGKLKTVPMTVCILLLCLVDMWTVNKRYLNDGMFEYPRPAEQIFAPTHADDVILLDPDMYYRTLDLTASTFNSNDASYLHKSIGGYHAAKLRRYQEVIEAHLASEMHRFHNAVVQCAGDLNAVNPDSVYPVLNMLNMKYAIMTTKDGEKAAVYNPHAMGNAWFAEDIHWVDNADDELAALSADNLHRTAVVDEQFREALGEGVAGADSTATVKLVEYDANRLAYDVTSRNGGVIVFSDIYYPGWTATVSDKEVPVARANYILRAIHVPAGQHRVVFEFDPRTVHVTETIAYCALSLLGLMLLGQVITLIYKRKKCQK
ncbi:MAG: YfhO family protein [Bacteroides sp.]|nr:YfhO family protein [Bacteroides sp.]MCM1447764.1 YfhO family protein [Bacteroides sp.]